VTIEPARPPEIVSVVAASIGLSARETEVLQHLLAGLSSVETGRQLFLSPHTVNDHVRHIYEKAGVRGRRELVAWLFFSHYAPGLGGARRARWRWGPCSRDRWLRRPAPARQGLGTLRRRAGGGGHPGGGSAPEAAGHFGLVGGRRPWRPRRSPRGATALPTDDGERRCQVGSTRRRPAEPPSGSTAHRRPTSGGRQDGGHRPNAGSRAVISALWS
jgi:DNA-binding CsgD family transcriptional regulator